MKDKHCKGISINTNRKPPRLIQMRRPTKNADIIISNNGTITNFNKAIDIIGAKIREVLKADKAST